MVFHLQPSPVLSLIRLWKSKNKLLCMFSVLFIDTVSSENKTITLSVQKAENKIQEAKAVAYWRTLIWMRSERCFWKFVYRFPFLFISTFSFFCRARSPKCLFQYRIVEPHKIFLSCTKCSEIVIQIFLQTYISQFHCFISKLSLSVTRLTVLSPLFKYWTIKVIHNFSNSCIY